MSDGTGIEWAEATWNPVVGCTRASKGCDHCYAVKMSHRLGAMAARDLEAGRDPGKKRRYMGLTVLNHRDERHFNGVVRLCHEELDARRVRRMRGDVVFVCSMSDLFHKDVPAWFIRQVFGVIKRVPEKTFLVLTKRPERMRRYFERHADDAALPNVWLGTSVEDQGESWRIDELVRCPASLRFLSCEPMIGCLDLTPWLDRLGWAIFGGESGPRSGVRWCSVDGILAAVGQCRRHGVPCFVKQLGDRPVVDYYSGDDALRDWAELWLRRVLVPNGQGILRDWNGPMIDGQPRPGSFIEVRLSSKGADMSEWPEALRVREVPAMGVVA